tara:strand:+ start:15195 stop:15299 length:105 start_codon:yes stop_codon:yes gene_type:complete
MNNGGNKINSMAANKKGIIPSIMVSFLQKSIIHF